MTITSSSSAVTKLKPWLIRVRNGGFSSNSYICMLQDGERCLVVDPGLDVAALEEQLQSHGVRPVAVFCTHGHFDHLGGADALARQYSTPVHIHAAEKKVVASANFVMTVCKVPGRVVVPQVDRWVDDGEQFTFSETECVRFTHSPGHTPGSCFIGFRDAVFSGDSLYRDTIGMVRLPGEDRDQLAQSLVRFWKSADDAALICPGHGGAGLLNDIKVRNADLRAFLEERFAPEEFVR